ncbi:protein stand still [Elysia marginata]|uniref:Protein stand still n=1 Tax=Elysia marginata TaxID=1093978 RepID=A0AAV4ECW8_9GAST|nr:protein stand still [Elysia marginata]
MNRNQISLPEPALSPPDANDSLTGIIGPLQELPREELDPRPGLSNFLSRQPKKALKRKAATPTSDNDELLTIAREKLRKPRTLPAEDQFDNFGKMMAQKLRDLPRDQRIIAEKLFSEVMFEAELGNLIRQSTLTLAWAYPTALHSHV